MTIFETPVAQEMIARKVPFRVEGGEIVVVGGFSKSGTVVLSIANDKVIATARYDEQTVLEDFDDLVYLAWDWYTRYSNREPFTTPDAQWVPFFVERGFLRVSTKVVTVYEVM